MKQLREFVARGQAAQAAVDRALDYSGWFTKVEAATRAGVTTKTIERWAAEGKLQQASRRQPHGPRLAVFHPGDVERLARELNPALPPFVEPVAAAPDDAPGPLVPREDVPAWLAPVLALAQAHLSRMSETSQTPPEPLYVDTATARARTGLGLRVLHAARRAGTVRARRTGGQWVWRAADFPQL